MKPRRCALLLLLLCAGRAGPGAAQRLRAVEVRWDNDILAVRGTGAPADYDYTQGLTLTAELAGADASRPVLRLSAGQRIYTPRRDGPETVPGERPYAGWLFSAAELSTSRAGTEHRVGVEIGMTGPAALGEPVQNGIHRLTGSTRQEGWDHQLGPELAGVVRYGAAWPRQAGGVRVRPRVEAGAGTRWTGAAGGVEASVGGPRGWRAEGGVRQEWVARNLFLDGNTFRRSVRAEKRAWVSEAAAAVGYRFPRWEVEYRFVIRGREYDAQPRPHAYGSLALTWHR